MVDVDTVIEKRKIVYEGLFSMTELYRLIDDYFGELAYDKAEKRMVESIREGGKYIEMHLEPYRKVTDYLQYRIHIKIIGEKVKEVEVEKDKRKIRLNKGKLQLIFDAYLDSDYEERWEDKPIYYFFRTLYNKFVMIPTISKNKDEVKKHCLDLMENIKSFLNLYRH